MRRVGIFSWWFLYTRTMFSLRCAVSGQRSLLPVFLISGPSPPPFPVYIPYRTVPIESDPFLHNGEACQDLGRAEEGGGACVCAFCEAAGGLPIVGMRRSVGFFCFLFSFLFLPSSCATREMPSKVTLHCIHAAMRTENGSEEWGRRTGRGRGCGCGRGRREQRIENRGSGTRCATV
ncbi:hypothetical protein LZ31DRAFT_97054 [Colletotrichum somersetense]|nr:hypothetical protein LZ31DRAFT_97054 [Colletotrichum somersetense]